MINVSKELIGKNISVDADHRISSRNRLVLSGMGLKVIDVSDSRLVEANGIFRKAISIARDKF